MSYVRLKGYGWLKVEQEMYHDGESWKFRPLPAVEPKARKTTVLGELPLDESRQ